MAISQETASIVMTPRELQALMDVEFPQAARIGVIESVGPMRAKVRHLVSTEDLRPGGTISGPTLMALADYSFYISLLAQIGPQPLAVTTSFSINFLRKPALEDVIARAKILKLGSRLAVGTVSLISNGGSAPIAHATMTYSIPPAPRRSRARASNPNATRHEPS